MYGRISSTVQDATPSNRRACGHCRADNRRQFSWRDGSRSEEERHEHEAIFKFYEPLRRGAVYRCQGCDRLWHRSEDSDFTTMTLVRRGRLQLLHAWSQERLRLPDAMMASLRKIGATPESQFPEVPCSVITHSGERIDLALVVFQPDAPSASWYEYRLASDIAELEPSPFALPLAVRRAAAYAPEARMGWSPSTLEMPDGARFTLSGREHFFVYPGYQATEARVAGGYDLGHLDAPVRSAGAPEPVIRFVADPPFP